MEKINHKKAILITALTMMFFLLLILPIDAFAQKTDRLNYVSDSLKTKVIKYHITQIIEQEKELTSKRTEVTISTQNINLYAEVEGQVAEFNTVIQNVDWNFNENLTKGYAIYTGYIKQENGNTTDQKILVEADENGKLKISDPNKPKGMTMLVDKWQVIK